MENNTLQELINVLEDIIDNAKTLPLSQKISLDKDEILEIVQQMRFNLPAEIQQAQRIVAKSNKFINDANVSAANIIRDAETKAEKMTMDKEIVKRAQEQADAILADAREEARNITENAEKEALNMRKGSLNYADELLSRASQGIQALHDELNKRTESVQTFLEGEVDAIYGERQELAKMEAELR